LKIGGKNITGVHIALGGAAVYLIYRALTAPRLSSLEGCNRNRDLSFPDDVYNVFADQIQSAIWYYMDGFAEDEKAVVQVMIQMETDDDVKEIICVYGIRGQAGYLSDAIYPDLGLVETLTKYLGSGHKETINEVYESRGISYRIL
jgi:hypothetical protein